MMTLSVYKNIETYESDKFDLIYDETLNARCAEVYNKKHSKSVKFIFKNIQKEEILEIIKKISFD